jgi:hypothetical protein
MNTQADYAGSIRPLADPSVPRLWPGETFVCLASGPSLTPADVDYCRGKARVIAIKDALRLAPWADVLYGSGGDTGRWWALNGPTLPRFPRLRYTLDPKAAKYAIVLENTGVTGIERNPTGLRTGKHSGYQAINLAVHLGARKVVLLGYDLQPNAGRDHWFGPHPYSTAPIPYWALRELFPSLLGPLAELGVELVNASRDTALTCVPRVSLQEALS